MQPPDESKLSAGPIILLGASVRAAAQSARRAGFDVTGVDLFGDTDTLSACRHYVPLGSHAGGQLLELHNDSDTPLMIVGGFQGTLDWKSLASCYPRCTQVDAVKKTRSLDFLRQITQGTEVKVPESSLPNGTGRILIKDLSGSGGLGVSWAAHQDNVTADQHLQQWVSGRAIGATFLAGTSTVRLLAVFRSLYKRIGRCPFVYSGSVGPLTIERSLYEQILTLGERVVQRSGIRGLFNLDLIIERKKLCLLEINPRWTASCELVDRGLQETDGNKNSLLKMAHECVAGKSECNFLSSQSFEFSNCYYKHVIFARNSGRFQSAAIRSLYGEPNVWLADLPNDESTIRKHNPVLTVVMCWPMGEQPSWRKIKRLLAKVQEAVS